MQRKTLGAWLLGISAAAILVPGCGNGGGFTPAPFFTFQQTPATATLARVQTTDLPGAEVSSGTAANASVAGSFTTAAAPVGTTAGPSLSNGVVSAQPGNPPKPVWIGQPQTFNQVIVTVPGQSGAFVVNVTPQQVGSQFVVGLDLVTAATAAGTVPVQFQTMAGANASLPVGVTLVIDPHVFQASGDMRNDNGGQNGTSQVADIFGGKLEGTSSTTSQNITNHDNNSDVFTVNSITVKGDTGPAATGHREVVWDGVADAFRDGRLNAKNPTAPNLPPTFFDRRDVGGTGDQGFGVRGGIVFQPISDTDGTTPVPGQQVNDFFDGTAQLAANTKTTLGGDFSNLNPAFALNLLAFTQNASFAPLGTTIIDCTFHVADSTTPATVHGMGVVFSSVDLPNVSSVEYFDASGKSIARVSVPTQFRGATPFAFPNPAGPSPAGAPATFNFNHFPYSFAGYLDNTANIARVRITSGNAAVDSGQTDVSSGGSKDVVIFDDCYYSEPNP